jgi:hypothetical protein
MATCANDPLGNGQLDDFRFRGRYALLGAANIDPEEAKNTRGPDCPAAAAGPVRLNLLQQQQSIAGQ